MVGKISTLADNMAMNESDDELLSGVLDTIDDDEDWNDTGWAQPVLPHSKTSLSPKPNKQGTADHRHHNKPAIGLQNVAGTLGLSKVPDSVEERAEISDKQLTALKESMTDSARDNAVIDRMSLNDNKAGMEGLDKARINQIIHEASKGSKFYENERRKEEQMKRRIEEQKLKMEKITDVQLQQGLIEADRLLEEFERYRDLSHTIVHIDMDAFYAAVAMRDDPSLKNKPMAVGGTAMLSTSNYHARKFGVRAAMPGFIGKKLCPDLIIVPQDFDKYTAVSKQVRSIMADYDPNFCPMSLDEAYLDITDHLERRKFMEESERTFLTRNRDFVDSTEHCLCDLNEGTMKMKLLQQADRLDKDVGGVIDACDSCGKKLPPFSEVVFGVDDEAAVEELRIRIEQRTRLTASAGIAPNMMLAKVCSDKNKPNGQYKVPASRESVMEFIKDLSTRKISGIGKVTETMLNALGVFTCTDLFEKRALLYHLYSSISFNYFMRICLGIGSTTVERDSERKSISTERTFAEISKPADLYKKCEELCEALAEDLKDEQMKGKTVSIKLKTVKFEVKTRAHTLTDYTADKDEIIQTATDLLKTEIQACSPQPLRLRLMGVRMSSLLHQSLCKNKKQNTITGLLKKMSEKNISKINEQQIGDAEQLKGTGDAVQEIPDMDLKAEVQDASDSATETAQFSGGKSLSEKQTVQSENNKKNSSEVQSCTDNSDVAVDISEMKELEVLSAQDINNNSDRSVIRENEKEISASAHDVSQNKKESGINQSLSAIDNAKKTLLNVETNNIINKSKMPEFCSSKQLEEFQTDTVNSEIESFEVKEILCKGVLTEQSNSDQQMIRKSAETKDNEANKKRKPDGTSASESECLDVKTIKLKQMVKIENESPMLYTPKRPTRSGLKRSPKNTETRKRRNSKRNSDEKSSAYVCLVCCQNMLFKDLNQFNEHIDDCIVEKNTATDHFPAPEVANQEKELSGELKNSSDMSSLESKRKSDRESGKVENVNQLTTPGAEPDKGDKDMQDFIVGRCQSPTPEEKSPDAHSKLMSNSVNCGKKKENTDFKDRLTLNHENFASIEDNLTDKIERSNEVTVLKAAQADTMIALENEIVNGKASDDFERKGSVIKTKLSDNCDCQNDEELNKDIEALNSKTTTTDRKQLEASETYTASASASRNAFTEDRNLGTTEILSTIVDENKVVMKVKYEESSQTEKHKDFDLEDIITKLDRCGNVYDVENQCDEVSSTNEKDKTKNDTVSDPPLPSLNLDCTLREPDDDYESGNFINQTEIKDNVKSFEVHDSTVDSTSTSENDRSKLETTREIFTKEPSDKPKIQKALDRSEIEKCIFDCKDVSDIYKTRHQTEREYQESEQPGCSFEITSEDSYLETGFNENTTDSTDRSLLVCPICNIEQRMSDLSAFNDHVDSCLSRGTISEILKEQKLTTCEKSKTKRSSSSVTPINSQKSAKRRKTNIQMPSCRSIASFFQEK